MFYEPPARADTCGGSVWRKINSFQVQLTGVGKRTERRKNQEKAQPTAMTPDKSNGYLCGPPCSKRNNHAMSLSDVHARKGVEGAAIAKRLASHAQLCAIVEETARRDFFSLPSCVSSVTVPNFAGCCSKLAYRLP